MTTTSIFNAAPVAATLLAVVIVLLFTAIGGSAHPLGNFTVNHFARIEAGQTRVRIRYVIDMAEIPTFQVTQEMPKNVDGEIATAALNDYLNLVASQYVRRLVINADGRRVELQTLTTTISMRHGPGGLPTLRVECDIEGALSESRAGVRTFHFEDTNDQDRAGWHEIVVVPAPYTNIFNSTAYGSQVTDELKTYPSDTLAAPLDERTAEFSWTAGSLPSGAEALRTRDGKRAGASRDRFVELINVQALTPLAAMLGLLLAAGLGALHALSPGHGKTVVAAYLVGSKGTPRHACFLGLTVTITHTAGVFALGLVTLFASQYILPERIFPILSFVSGAILLVIGLTLFVRRLAGSSHMHHAARPNADHSHHHIGLAPVTHTHGGGEHSHIPPGTDGTRVTWRSLLALGISGGLLPCPSALVVLLSQLPCIEWVMGCCWSLLSARDSPLR